MRGRFPVDQPRSGAAFWPVIGEQRSGQLKEEPVTEQNNIPQKATSTMTHLFPLGYCFVWGEVFHFALRSLHSSVLFIEEGVESGNLCFARIRVTPRVVLHRHAVRAHALFQPCGKKPVLARCTSKHLSFDVELG